MSCERCEIAADQGQIIWYRWGAANVGIVACVEHGKEIIEYLNKRGEAAANGPGPQAGGA